MEFVEQPLLMFRRRWVVPAVAELVRIVTQVKQLAVRLVEEMDQFVRLVADRRHELAPGQDVVAGLFAVDPPGSAPEAQGDAINSGATHNGAPRGVGPTVANRSAAGNRAGVVVDSAPEPCVAEGSELGKRTAPDVGSNPVRRSENWATLANAGSERRKSLWKSLGQFGYTCSWSLSPGRFRCVLPLQMAAVRRGRSFPSRPPLARSSHGGQSCKR